MLIAVTGASGFVGGHLINRLGMEGVEVLAFARSKVDRLPDNARWQVLPDLSAGKGGEVELKGVSVVVHLAGRAHLIKDAAANPLDEFRKVNTEATVAIARQALQAEVKRFVFVSTIGVHGACTSSPLHPGSYVNPVDDYAISKYEAEQKLRELFHGTATELIIVRPPMVYAADAPGNFQRLIAAVSKGIPLPFGCARNRRSLISVSNLSEILWLLTMRPLASGDIILPCDGEILSTKDMIVGIGKVIGRPARLLPIPTSLLYMAAALLGKRRAAIKVLGDYEIDPSPLREQIGWRGGAEFSRELQASFEMLRNGPG